MEKEKKQMYTKRGFEALGSYLFVTLTDDSSVECMYFKEGYIQLFHPHGPRIFYYSEEEVFVKLLTLPKTYELANVDLLASVLEGLTLQQASSKLSSYGEVLLKEKVVDFFTQKTLCDDLEKFVLFQLNFTSSGIFHSCSQLNGLIVRIDIDREILDAMKNVYNYINCHNVLNLLLDSLKIYELKNYWETLKKPCLYYVDEANTSIIKMFKSKCNITIPKTDIAREMYDLHRFTAPCCSRNVQKVIFYPRFTANSKLGQFRGVVVTHDGKSINTLLYEFGFVRLVGPYGPSIVDYRIHKLTASYYLASRAHSDLLKESDHFMILAESKMNLCEVIEGFKPVDIGNLQTISQHNPDDFNEYKLVCVLHDANNKCVNYTTFDGLAASWTDYNNHSKDIETLINDINENTCLKICQDSLRLLQYKNQFSQLRMHCQETTCVQIIKEVYMQISHLLPERFAKLALPSANWDFVIFDRVFDYMQATIKNMGTDLEDVKGCK